MGTSGDVDRARVRDVRRRCRTRVVREDERSAERPNARRRRGARREAVATDGRDERIEREPLDRGPSPHVSCQAKARVPICAPKDRFTRVLAASFTGAPRYTREVFILGSRSSRVFVRRRHSKKIKTKKTQSHVSTRGGAAAFERPRCSVEEEVVLWIGMRTGSAY